MKILQIVWIVLLSLLIVLPTKTSAQTTSLNQFVTIVNPVRISFYTKDPKVSLEAQYWEVKKRKLSATWLLTYDAILDEGIESVAKEMDQSQELGIFLEITPAFAKDSGVVYNKTDSWHRANSVFLTGYTQSDRIKMIDKIFEKFKNSYGNYPVSVGGWWIDSFSLEYMQNKYKITANLGVSDQFSTDGYQIWGQYFGVPFYPSKFHAGIPAATLVNKLDVVSLEWAPRDPLNGYGKGSASLFSTQDYFTINLPDEYFQKLVNLYTKKRNNKFGQITIGLEGDFSPETYSGKFAKQLDMVLALKDKGIVDIVTMEDFANWYKSELSQVSPVQIIEADDFLGEKIKAIWYQSPNFRIFITYDYKTNETRLKDFRIYHDNFEEPYYISPNRDLNLSINIPSLIDSVGNPQEAWVVTKEKLEETEAEGDDMVLKYENETQIRLSEDSLKISGKMGQIPKIMTNTPSVKISKQDNTFSLFPQNSWIYPQEGLIFRDLTPQATNFLRQRKIIIAEVLIVISLLMSIFFVGTKGLSKTKRLILAVYIVSAISGAFFWYLSNSQNYFVSQAELDALIRLSSIPGSKVVVFDQVCLQCSFHTKFPPALFANKRRYVADISKKGVIYNPGVFSAKTREEARNNLSKLGADYIYVVKFEDYTETVPFSPGDLNLEEIYSNANATIWKIKKN